MREKRKLRFGSLAGSRVDQLLRIRDCHRYVGFSRSRRDGAILIYAKIEIPQRAPDLICGATAAEDRPSEVIFEGIARPISGKHSTREDMRAVADPSRHRSSVITGETRIGPFESFLGDCGIGKGESCVRGVLRAAGSTRIAQMCREYLRYIGILDVVAASAWCRAVS